MSASDMVAFTLKLNQKVASKHIDDLSVDALVEPLPFEEIWEGTFFRRCARLGLALLI